MPNSTSSKPRPLPQTITRAAKPTREIFDAFNSSATGHQRAENRLSGSTHWRDSRSAKLAVQFGSGLGGGRRVADTVGAGSEDFGKDGRAANGAWLPGAKGLRGHGQRSLWDAFGAKNEAASKRMSGDALRVTKVVEPAVLAEEKLSAGLDRLEAAICSDPTPQPAEPRPRTSQELYEDELLADIDFDAPIDINEPDVSERGDEPQHSLVSRPEADQAPTTQIFRNLTIYVNGSTAPLISDHKLKRVLVDNGANLSIALGRKSVTHVILGHPNGSLGSGSGLRGAGGGLASSKVQKEISQARNLGTGVRFVTAEWVVASVRAGKRLPEGQFEALRLAPKGVRSVASMFARK